MMEAQIELATIIKKKPTSVIALEIGGGNGLQGMILGASTQMNIPTVDGDWMGRAYPTKWQTTPVVFSGQKRAVFLPITMCDGGGNVVVRSDGMQRFERNFLMRRQFMTKATSDLMAERVLRAGLSQLGSHCACADGPISGGLLFFISLGIATSTDFRSSGYEEMGCRAHHFTIMENWQSSGTSTAIKSN